MILNYKGIQVFYKDSGKGSAIVLLHGFLEDHSMWKDAVTFLSKKNRVITIDLLGHGQTACLGYVHSMKDQSELVFFVLKHLKLRRYTLIGHSMGGYISLEFSRLYTSHIKALCLMNSTFQADNEERKQLRARANKMVQANFENMVRMSFANLFSEESKTKFKSEYTSALNIALQTDPKGYIASNEGMRLREDRSGFYAEAPFSKLIILGKKDTLLDYLSIQKFCKKHQTEITLLSEGHMSHIENKEEFLQKIMHFIEKIQHIVG